VTTQATKIANGRRKKTSTEEARVVGIHGRM
jgi:hypothetical protein